MYDVVCSSCRSAFQVQCCADSTYSQLPGTTRYCVPGVRDEVYNSPPAPRLLCPVMLMLMLATATAGSTMGVGTVASPHGNQTWHHHLTALMHLARQGRDTKVAQHRHANDTSGARARARARQGHGTRCRPTNQGHTHVHHKDDALTRMAH